MEDWSLHAIVRGSSGDFSSLDFDHPSLLEFPSMQYHYGLFDASPEVLGVAGDSRDGLEELYKPFYPVQESVMNEICVEDKQSVESDGSSGNTRAKANCSPNIKRRKNQQKRVVVQVCADEVASDKWAWRKYGQKPIKGSPYPRSYYRCSSSKGCLARKQVEQSFEDPGMFILTYTAEHNHSQPTRRNSLSGTVRQKFPSPKMMHRQERAEESSSSNNPHLLFPSHQLTMEPQEPHLLSARDHQDGFLDGSFAITDDFFSGLEDFDDYISELAIL